MRKQNVVTVLAPAKLNLALDVVGLLPNGYHDLDMTMQAITLYERVVLRRSPQHDLQALLQHLAAGQHQHGHGGLGRGVQQALWLVAQHHLAQFAGLATDSQRQPGAHGVGAAAKGIEDGQGSAHAESSSRSFLSSLELNRARVPGCRAPICACPR